MCPLPLYPQRLRSCEQEETEATEGARLVVSVRSVSSVCSVSSLPQSAISNLRSAISNLHSAISNLRSPTSDLESAISNLRARSSCSHPVSSAPSVSICVDPWFLLFAFLCGLFSSYIAALATVWVLASSSVDCVACAIISPNKECQPQMNTDEHRSNEQGRACVLCNATASLISHFPPEAQSPSPCATTRSTPGPPPPPVGRPTRLQQAGVDRRSRR